MPTVMAHEHASLSQTTQAEPRILVVDDEPVNILVLKGLLKSEGFQVVSATSGEEARLAMAEQLPDIILLDIMMPEESGFETCVRLKQDPATLDIPVIFVSALTDVENKVRGLELGAVDYISKPFEKAEVLARVRLHIKLAMARKALIAEQSAKLKQLSDAQRAMLVRPEEVPQARFAVSYLPALEAGGDFYDVLPIHAATCCYFVADICGHDLGSSFVTSSLKALLHQNSGPLFSPEETLRTMNSVLSTVIFGGRFLTAQSLHVDRARNRAVLVNAGHLAPVLHPVGNAPCLLQASGDILGVFQSVYLEPLTFGIQPGDRIYMYTDGLLERFCGDRRSAARGQEELLQRVQGLAGVPLEDCVQTIIKEMGMQGHAAEDDIVLLAVEV